MDPNTPAMSDATGGHPPEPTASGRRLVLMGQGYVGLPVAMQAVARGYSVVGFDVDEARVKRLNAGESYVEDVADEVLQHALGTGRYRATTTERDCGGFDVAVITVPTPLREGVPDLSYIEASARTLGRYLRPGATVVLESTTYPGTTEELVKPVLEEMSGLLAGADFYLGYSPERIDPGNPTWGFVNTPKVVSGIDEASLAAVDTFYSSLVDRTVPVAGPKEAELTKLLENTFRHVNVALVNELAMFAGDLGIDVWAAIDAASSKPFGYMRFTPGPGVGGHCLPIDPSYLSWRVRRSLGHTFRFVELANDVNDHMPDYVVRRLTYGLNRRRKALNGSRMLLLGLAYKRNTSDSRESPARVVAERLVALGAEVRVVDSHVGFGALPFGTELVSLSAEELRASDAVVMLTDHDDLDLDLVIAHAPYVLDTRRVVPAADHVEYL
jgi:UDP-N-acetyl-D-glucosamine dehydrogenase